MQVSERGWREAEAAEGRAGGPLTNRGCVTLLLRTLFWHFSHRFSKDEDLTAIQFKFPMFPGFRTDFPEGPQQAQLYYVYLIAGSPHCYRKLV